VVVPPVLPPTYALPLGGPILQRAYLGMRSSRGRPFIRLAPSFLLALSHRGAAVEMVSSQGHGHLTDWEYYLAPAHGILLHFVA
jgi:hypothetical protein